MGSEQCDDGNNSPGDGCTACCSIEPGWFQGNPIIGDGLVVGNENCDDSNANNGDGCTNGMIDPGYTCTIMRRTPPEAGLGGVCTPVCGDSLLVGIENCDDGNTLSGDGCGPMCQPETGWRCTGMGPGSCQPICGDSRLLGDEMCDDGDVDSGDGCSSSCMIESGFACSPPTGNLPSVCTVGCGNGEIAGQETCDDMNLMSGDGCSATCQLETGFVCVDGINSPSSCASVCGDGMVVQEEACDDTNTFSGDGCSSGCRIEDGYICTGTPSNCTTVCGDQVIIPPEECDDGNQLNGDGCDASCVSESGFNLGSGPIAGIVVGIVVFACCLMALITAGGVYYYRKKRVKVFAFSDFDFTGSNLGSHISMDSMSETPSYAKSLIQQLHYTAIVEGSDLIIDKKLGGGAFGVVYQGLYKNKTIAIKQIKGESIDEQGLKNFLEEAKVTAYLPKHEHVVGMIGICPRPLSILIDYCAGGSLRDLLISDSPISFEQQIMFMQHIAAGMSHIHASDIVHRDLAARNVLLDQTKTVGKVSDFGMSRLAATDSNYTEADVGPLKWMAPESLIGKKYSKKTDVWAFGVTCVEILTRQKPFPDLDLQTFAVKFLSGGVRVYQTLPADTPRPIYDLIVATQCDAPEKRPSFSLLYQQLSAMKTHGNTITMDSTKSVRSFEESSVSSGGLTYASATKMVNSVQQSELDTARREIQAQREIIQDLKDQIEKLRRENTFLKTHTTSSTEMLSAPAPSPPRPPSRTPSLLQAASEESPEDNYSKSPKGLTSSHEELDVYHRTPSAATLQRDEE